MAADFNKPTVTSAYADFPTEIRENFDAVAQLGRANTFTQDQTVQKSQASIILTDGVDSFQIYEDNNGQGVVGGTVASGNAIMNFQGRKITGLGDGSAATDSVTYGQLGSAAFEDIGAGADDIPVLNEAASASYNRWASIIAVTGKLGILDVANQVLTTGVNGESTYASQATAFNKAFGTGSGQVAEGNHTHSSYVEQTDIVDTNAGAGASSTGTVVFAGYSPNYGVGVFNASDGTNHRAITIVGLVAYTSSNELITISSSWQALGCIEMQLNGNDLEVRNTSFGWSFRGFFISN